MEGGDAPESTVSRMRDEASVYDDAATYLDAETVIVLPEPDEPSSLAETAFEEGISMLREGKAAEADSLFSSAEDELKDRPEFHAAVAVVMDMLERHFDALDHYERLQAMDGSNRHVQSRIDRIKSSQQPLLTQGSSRRGGRAAGTEQTRRDFTHDGKGRLYGKPFSRS